MSDVPSFSTRPRIPERSTRSACADDVARPEDAPAPPRANAAEPQPSSAEAQRPRADPQHARRQARDGESAIARQLHARVGDRVGGDRVGGVRVGGDRVQNLAPVPNNAPAAPARPLVIFAPQFGNAANDNVISLGSTALRRRLDASGCEVLDMTNRSGADLTARLRERLANHNGPVMMYIGGHGAHSQDFQAGHAHHTIAAMSANGTARNVDTARDLIRPVYDALGPNAQLGVFISSCQGGVAAENFHRALPAGAGGANGRVAVVATSGPDQLAMTHPPVGLDPAESLLLQMATPSSTVRPRADRNNDGSVSAGELTQHANNTDGGLAMAGSNGQNFPALPGPLSFQDPFSAAAASFLAATPTQNVTVTTQRVVAGGNLALPIVPNAPRDLPAHLPVAPPPTLRSQNQVAAELRDGLLAQGVLPLSAQNDASLAGAEPAEITTNRGARMVRQPNGEFDVTNPNGTRLRVQRNDHGHMFTTDDPALPVRVDGNGNVSRGAWVDAAVRSYRPVALNRTTGALETGDVVTPPP